MDALPLRVTSRIDRSSPTGCWNWTGAQQNGYGLVGWQRKVVKVHRLIWEHERGPIPDGAVIDHLCRNRTCCNPAHLRVTTNYNNVMDPAALGVGAQNSRKTHCPAGHPLSGDNLMASELKRGARRCLTCRRVYARMQSRKRRLARQ